MDVQVTLYINNEYLNSFAVYHKYNVSIKYINMLHIFLTLKALKMLKTTWCCAHKILYLYILLLYWFLRTVVNIHRPSVVVLQRWSDHYVIEAIQVEVRNSSDCSAEACAAGLVLTDAFTVAPRVSCTTGLIDRLQCHLMFKQSILRETIRHIE